MRSYIANSIERLEIKEFDNISFKQIFTVPVKCEITSLRAVLKNIEENGCYYLACSNEYEIYAFLANIGKQENPLIEVSYASTWFNSNLGGVYLIGYDKIKKELFAPLHNKSSR